jgi:4-azaleucine resistance transporter AzlC
MTALFVVIFIEQWISSNSRLPQIIGIFCGVVSLILFGPGNFILPALISCISILLILNKFEKKKTTISVDLSE